MFATLSDRLTGVFDTLRGRGALSQKDVDAAMREIRIALLEADVALPVVRAFIASVSAQAVGENVMRAVKPGEQIVKIVHDALVDVLAGTPEEQSAQDKTAKTLGLNLNTSPPSVLLMAGLQGAGKTTMSAKIALFLRTQAGKKILMASLDTYRPAAMEQLAVLAKQAEVDCLPIERQQKPLQIAKRALKQAQLGGYEVLILDTAGRTTIDAVMMGEIGEIAKLTTPSEILLVADSLSGQDAVKTAQNFHAHLPLTGLALTRIDGDGRGGAALSMRAVSGLSIKVLGTGERLSEIEKFDATRLAGRILGQGDIVSLVEKAAQVVDEKQAHELAKKLKKGRFDLDDLAVQLRQIEKMGGMGGMMGLMPGMGKLQKKMQNSSMFEDKTITRQCAIISSMTPRERTQPAILKASRKKRIACGSGTQVQEVNKLLKMHRQMADMMASMGKKGGKSQMSTMLSHLGMDANTLAQSVSQGQNVDVVPHKTPQTASPQADLQNALTRLQNNLPSSAKPSLLPGLGGVKPPFSGIKKPNT